MSDWEEEALFEVPWPMMALFSDCDRSTFESTEPPAILPDSVKWRGNSTLFNSGSMLNSGKICRNCKGSDAQFTNMKTTRRRSLPCSVKLNKGGRLRPLGNRVFGSLNSSKKDWAHACKGEIRDDGLYSNKRETNSIASWGVRVRNTCKITFRVIKDFQKMPLFYCFKDNRGGNTHTSELFSNYGFQLQ